MIRFKSSTAQKFNVRQSELKTLWFKPFKTLKPFWIKSESEHLKLLELLERFARAKALER